MPRQKGECWVIYDAGKHGTGNQCIGLAERLGYTPQIYESKPTAFWRCIPRPLWPDSLHCVNQIRGHRLRPPWPRLLIASGRSSVMPALVIKGLAGEATKLIAILDPKIAHAKFDRIIAPAHDQLAGINVISTIGALHQLTVEKLKQAKEKFTPQFKELPFPRIAVLIGSHNSRYRMNRRIIHDIVSKLKGLENTYDASFLITISRRTTPRIRALFAEELRQNLRNYYFWQGEGANPYFGYLAMADHIIVTSDSVSMISEACFTGKPVYVYHLPGGNLLTRRFHRALETGDYVHPFTGVLDSEWTPQRLDEFPEVIERLRDLIPI